jgi:hypothetical protein
MPLIITIAATGRKAFAVTENAQAPDTIWVMYLPYLPVGERVPVGSWEIIPRADLGASDCLDRRTLSLAQGLASLYVLPSDAQQSAGAFISAADGQIGSRPGEQERLWDLYRAVVLAVLESNESPLLPEEERDPNAIHYALTSDNAQIVVHPVNWEHGFTGAVSGSRVRYRSLGIPVLQEHPDMPHMTLPPPADLRIPFSPRPFDGEYAAAAWDCVQGTTDASRRLGRAIDWLALAWLNLTTLSDEIRIPALRAGFEVLLESDDFAVLAKRLAKLLGDESEAVERTWPKLLSALGRT